MDQKKQPRPLSLEDIFAEAAERVQAGEPVDAVIASYAPEYHKQLRGLLPIVETASQLHHAEIPTIAADRRSANRRALLLAAAQKRAEVSTLASAPARKSVVVAAPSLGERLTTAWAAFLASFAVRPMRLAMTLAALALLIFGPTTLVTQAQSSIPGDLTYPVKQWMRAQELAFTPIDRRAEVIRQQEEEYREDIEKAQVKADEQNLLISSHAIATFQGYVGEYWQIGSLRVMPYYQTDLSKTDRIAMRVSGNLAPGAIVMLTYQILPGQQGNVPDSPVVQGIALEVMQPPPGQEGNAAVVAPTPIPTIVVLPFTATPLPSPTDTPSVAEPEVTYEPPATCTATAPSGWVPYNPLPGDTLGTIAQRFGVSIDELRAANCLASDEAPPGPLILVPDQGELPTSEPTATEVSTATATVAPTVAISPTVVVTATATPAATTAITPTTTSAPPVTSTGVITPTTATPPAGTPPGTAVPVSTTVAGPTATNAATPGATAPPVATPTGAATEETPATPEAPTTEATPTMPPETPTEEGVSGASITPTVEPPTVEPVVTEAPPTEAPTAVPEPPTEPPPPTDTPAAASEGVMAAEALPSDAVEPAGQPDATEPSPDRVSQPDSPLPNP